MGLLIFATLLCFTAAFRQTNSARIAAQDAAEASRSTEAAQGDEADDWPWDKFQDDLSSVKAVAEVIPRFAGCERIAVVLEGDANRPDMRTEALMWVDFLGDQGYCIAYFFDWVTHASAAWSSRDITMNFGLGWKDALKEVEQSDSGQVIQILNSTRENWMEFTGGLEALCAQQSCPTKRVVMAFEDHGEYRLLGLPGHEKMLREEFLGGLRSLYRLSPEVKLLSYVSACKSGSMFGGPQYTAKELLQSHYIDCDLRAESCMQGPISSQVSVIAGHSIVGMRQRVLLRATEGLLEAQAMCDLATGDDVPGLAIASKMLSGLPAEKKAEIEEKLKALSENPPEDDMLKALVAFFAQGGEMKEPPAADEVFQPRLQKGFERMMRLSAVFEMWKSVATALQFDAPDYLKTALKDMADETALPTFQLWLDDGATEGDEQDKPKRLNVTETVSSIREVFPDFSLAGTLAEEDLRESRFLELFNREVLLAWFEIRLAVDAWKADGVGDPFWQKLSNGASDASTAKQASAKVPWGAGCGTMSECLGTFGRAQTLTKLHDQELGCLPGGLASRWEGHVMASAQGEGGEGIEENGGLADSHMGDHLKHLLRAIAYSSDDELEAWDRQLMAQRGKHATGDFDYEDDPMWGAATDGPEPLDLLKELDGAGTRPESVLAMSASVPQIISSSLLPFTVGSISDIRDRLKSKTEGEVVDTSFRAHVRSVEDLAINKESMNMDMMFGMYSRFLKIMLWAKGNEDATLSVTAKDAGERAAEFERLANNSWWFKKSQERKAEFYRAISEGALPTGFLSFTYVSPASGRTITRLFDTMLSAENFGSPIAFGNMMDTDLSDFFHHVPSAMERFQKRMAELGDDVLQVFQAGGDWFSQMTEPKTQLGDDQSRCCCKGPDRCELLVGDELKKSRNPLKWGEAVCPSHLGYQQYKRFGLEERPKSCSAQGTK